MAGVLQQKLAWCLLALLSQSASLSGTTDASPATPSIIPSAATPATTSSTTPKPRPCKRPCTANGVCDPHSGTCQCFPGWTGDRCHLCGGKVKLNSTKGWLADAVGNYTVDSQCTWLIEAPSERSTIRLHLKEFATECGWDHLYIFDGDSVFSDLSAVYSGMVRNDPYNVQQVPELTGTSGNMLIHFYSDVAYNMTGFNITFSINSCPSQRHDLTCSGHGFCDQGKCHCDEDFKGDACNIPACPQNCEPEGIRKGSCNKQKKRCDCLDGWTGEACSQAVSNGYWQALSHVGGNVPPPRTSHAAMVDTRGRMWIVGGETFSHTRHMVATFSPDLDNQDVQGVWRAVHSKGNKGPTPRFGHSAVIHDDKIYMYGGTMRSGHVSRELWSLDLSNLVWERVEMSQGQCMASGQAKLCGPINSMGHTANVLSNRMIVIFGHSPKYGYLDTVQEYHFGNKEWSIVPTSGYPVRGGFGHTSVWDDITNRIYVYGGYVSTASTAAAITNAIYSLDPIGKRWTIHTPSTSYRYLHSSVASGGLMIVFAGNTHNDTSWSHGAKCYSADILAYDMVCDTWHSMQSLLPEDLSVDLARFGHSAVMLNKTMLVHGGFHGVLKNDLLAFTPGQCAMYKSRPSCLAGLIGVKCVWNSKKSSCESHPPNRAKSGYDTCSAKAQNYTDECHKLSTCSSCTSTSYGCVWCRGQCKWRSCDGLNGSRKARFNSGFSSSAGGQQGGKDVLVSTKATTTSQAPSFPVISKLDECVDVNQASNADEWCPTLHTCHSCVVMPGCQWDIDKVSHCKEIKRKTVLQQHPQRPSVVQKTNLTTTSSSSEEKEEDTHKGSDHLLPATVTQQSSTCSLACIERTTCNNCTHGLCMWCKNLGMCIDRNAYLASFPYGQCMDWTTQSEQCPEGSKNDTETDDVCVGYRTCDSCRGNPTCGWCDDGSGTGVGTCMIGGASGPLVKQHKALGHVQWVAAATCPASDGKSWHFTSCPECMCNGHSSCSKQTDTCDQPCQHNTEGQYCHKCAKGYFGYPVNGGKCEACQCNGQASTCNHRTGSCHCTTKGIIGDKCQSCDKVNHYYGDPITDSCFYELAIDYQFTFNLSKADDKHLTAINFKNTPTKVDVDVDFSISCSVQAKMNLTVRHTPANAKNREERVEQMFVEQNCSMFKNRFSKDDFVFGVNDENTTFHVYVYDFEPPLWIIISFSQHPKLDLLQFFITFSTCFLALLLVAAILWKIKQKYDRYRRRQRLFVEMEQMASRPFGSVLVELEQMPADHSAGNGGGCGGGNNTSSAAATSTGNNSSASGANSSSTGIGVFAGSTGTASREDAGHTRRRRKRLRPSPIALEPCAGNRAAVLSLIVRLPTGGKPYTPNGYTGIAVASSLVTLGNPRKPSSDTPSRQSLDDPKSGRKGRKCTNSQSADI